MLTTQYCSECFIQINTHPHNHLGGKEYFELHFTDEETKAQRAKENCTISKFRSSSIWPLSP